MINRPRDGVGPPQKTTSVLDEATELQMLRARVGDLEREVTTMGKGLQTRQRIGFVTGVLGQRFGLQPDEAWALLAQVSYTLNVKAHRVADVLLDAYTGQLAPSEVKLASRISELLPQPSLPADLRDPVGGVLDAQAGDVNEPTRPA